MLTLIKLIPILDRQIDTAISATRRSGKVDRSGDRPRQMRWQQLSAIVALSLGSLGQIPAATAQTVNTVSIRQSLLASGDRSPVKSKPKFAQTNPPTTPKPTATPPAPTETAPAANTSNPKLPNDLNLPNTGSQVQITGKKSLTLKEAIDIAFRNNRDIQAARLSVDRSQSSIREAQAAQALQVGLTGNLQNQGSAVIFGNQNQFNTGNSTGTNAQGTVQATYNVLNAGRDQGSVRAAEEQVRFDKLDLLRVEQLIRGQVLTAYYDLQAADSSVIINQAAVTDATRSLSDAQLQERAGVGTRFDILRAQVQLATANQDLANAQGQQQTARKKLAQLLVVDNNTEFTAADTVRELGSWGYSLEDSVIIAFRNRPEARQRLVQRSISQQQEIVAAAADSAQVNLFANYSLAKTLTSSNNAQDNYALGAQFRWNFWDGGAAGARSSQQRVTQEITENQFTTARNQIRFEVEQAFSSLNSNQKNIATSTQALKQAEESLKLARLRFQAGVGTQTDVIQAQTELARARGNRITAIVNYNRSLSSLRTATVLNE
jgi:outer membrane protein TolC